MGLKSWLLLAVVAAAIGTFCGCDRASGSEPGANNAAGTTPESKTISFATDVKPILDKHCEVCHLAEGRKGGFNMESRENALTAGKNGPRIVEGNGAGSNLILRVSHDPSVRKMPPKGEALTPDEVATLKAWIDQGAKWN